MPGSVSRNTTVLLILMLSMTTKAWASPASHVLMFKGGQFHWADRTQETARTDVEYESGSGIYIIGFERRSRYISLGVELAHSVSDWEATDPVATRQNGRLELGSVSFVPRKYFKPIGEFVPYIGAGIGSIRIKSEYSLGTTSDSNHEYGVLYQLNFGGEWRWEGTGLMFEIKRMHAQIDDFTLAGDKDDFPGISGTAGLLGLSFIF